MPDNAPQERGPAGELEQRVRDLERRIADLRARLPKHTPPPVMMIELDELEEALRLLASVTVRVECPGTNR